jgi:hypothetical protein
MANPAQGETFSWGGAVGEVISISVSPRKANLTDVTTMGNAGVESGGFVVRRYECLSVDSGEASVRFFGNGFAVSDIGTKAGLSALGVSGEAILESYEVEASVGDLVRASAKFRFTGN